MRVRALVVAVGLMLATSAAAEATTITFNSDGTWSAKDSTPGTGWDTDVAFDEAADGGWQNATVTSENNGFCAPFDDKGCRIWYDDGKSQTMEAWIRDVFFIDFPIISATLAGGIDDDGIMMINGNPVYISNNQQADAFGPMDITQYLQQGNNLFAAYGKDLSGTSMPGHTIHARITIETPDVTPVPEPTSLVLLGSGLSAWAVRQRRARRGVQI